VTTWLPGLPGTDSAAQLPKASVHHSTSRITCTIALAIATWEPPAILRVPPPSIHHNHRHVSTLNAEWRRVDPLTAARARQPVQHDQEGNALYAAETDFANLNKPVVHARRDRQARRRVGVAPRCPLRSDLLTIRDRSQARAKCLA